MENAKVNVKANKRALWLIGIGLALALLAGSMRTLVMFITDFQWFDKNGYLTTFLVSLLTRLKILIPFWLVASVSMYFYLMGLKKKYYKYGHLVVDKKEDKKIRLGTRIFSGFAGLYFAWLIAESIWLKLLMFMNATTFNVVDPIFFRDIGFYLFQLPFLKHVLSLTMMVTVWMVIITAGFYFIMFNLRKPMEGSLYDMNEIAGRPNFNSVFSKDLVKTAVNKIALLGGIILALISATYFLKAFELLYSARGAAYGASYTDINVTLIGYRVVMVVALISSVAFVYGLLRDHRRIAVVGPAALLVIGIVTAIFAGVVQQLVVEPDEIARESEYLVNNIEFTQAAFNLDKVNERDFPMEQVLDRETLERNVETMSNIRINDYRPLLQTYNQIQGLRLYYRFNDVDLDRYMIDGRYSQVFISPRELDISKLDVQAQTWLNMHLRFTHGYGAVVSPVNSVTNEGQPELIVKNVPPITEANIRFERPEIYFGELTNHYVIINTTQDEFDYPSGSENKNNRYDGGAGLELKGFNKFLFAFRESSMKMLFSSAVEPESRILLYRNINERVRKIAPFLMYDQNPYLVLNQEDGKLYWIIDAYTSSKYYPYSQPYRFNNQSVNYLRNSVKVVIDAYEGTTTFYLYDETDPVAQTLDGIFTDLFTDASQMPASLKAHVRYPQDYFDLQSEVYRTYHVDNPVVFYNGEDVWDVANEKYMDGVQRIESNYVLFKLPDGDREEFSLIIPYTPKEKANMTSLFVARNDGDQYGNLFLYKYPKDKTIQGPMMIESRIDQDSTISPQFTLWGQQGSNVLRGNVIVVPVEDAILYVEPIYIQADNANSLPEMKRVIVAYQEKIVMEETLEEALAKIFGEDIPAEITQPVKEGEEIMIPADQVRQLLNQINNLFEESSNNLEELQQLIDQLNEELAPQEPQVEPEPDPESDPPATGGGNN